MRMATLLSRGRFRSSLLFKQSQSYCVIHPIHRSVSNRASSVRNGVNNRLLSTSTYRHTQTQAHTSSSSHSPKLNDTQAEDLPRSNSDDSRVAIGWEDGNWSRFHHIWLRDHCRCSECFHPKTKQRLLDTFSILPDIRPSEVKSLDEGLQVIWPTSPPHVSTYPWDWLRRNSYDPILQNESVSVSSATPDSRILWGSKIQKNPPTVTYDEVMQDDVGVLRWLEKIDQFGFCFVSGVPATTDDTEKLARRINFIRETQYGGFWDFTSDLSHGDTAYTSIALPAHTDNTYYTDPCGLQLFHLLSHTDGSGGQTLLVDGFYAASILKALHPTSYALLSNIPIPAHAAGDNESLYRPTPPTGYPILIHDEFTKAGKRLGDHEEGELRQVRYNNDDRSVMKSLDPSMVIPWYDALRHWNECLKSPDSEYWVQLGPGTAVVVDNHRVLHGRSSFTGKRRMCGAYIGRDDYRSRFDVLRGRYSQSAVAKKGESIVIKERSVWDPLF